MKLAMGIYDDPYEQKQPTFIIDNFLTHIAVLGGPMSGKTTFIKRFLVCLCKDSNPKPKEDVYIIDFGGNINNYSKLPNVCACFDSSNEENIKRVFKTIDSRIEENMRLLGGKNFAAFAEANAANCPNHITLIVENINTFLSDERYSLYQEKLVRLCRDGLSKGITVIITANDLTGLGSLMPNFGQKVIFEMPTDNYFEIFNSKVNKPIKIPGRCMVNLDSAVYECQISLPFKSTDDDIYISKMIEEKKHIVNLNKLQAFPEVITIDDMAKYSLGENMAKKENENILVGLDYYNHNEVCVNINESRVIAIYGKKMFGKTNLLTGIIEKINTNYDNVRFVYLEDGRNEVENLYEKNKDRSEIFYNSLNLMEYLIINGYLIMKYKNWESKNIKDNPFTVFVIQAKSFYQDSTDSRNLLKCIADDMFGRAEQQNYLFIFSDVKKISDHEMQKKFNNMISTAFLLDDIGEFVTDRGSKSVFGEMDAKELKAEYARCSVGDGYCYDIETDTLKKLKFFKFL